MPNGFHGPKEEWDRMEAPYLRIDPILAAFSQRHRVELYKNYRDADRSLRFNDALSRAIWVNATDRYGANGTYQVSVIAHQDRPERYIKGAMIAETVVPGDLDRILEDAARVVASWSEHDLQPARYSPEPRWIRWVRALYARLTHHQSPGPPGT